MNQMQAIRSGLEKLFLPKIPTFEDLKAQREKDLACIMAIGKANPPNIMEQSTFSDLCFRITKTKHMVELKKKFQRICENTAIKRRHLVGLGDAEEETPSPRVHGAVAECKAAGGQGAYTKTWSNGSQQGDRGVGAAQVMHHPPLFCTNSGVDLTGADCHIIKLLGLNANVQRIMLYQQGCGGCGTFLPLAKCLAESCRGGRVLVVCFESTVMGIRTPSEQHQDQLVIEALIGDGASAVVVGADLDEEKGEKAIFTIVSGRRPYCPIIQYIILVLKN